MSERSGLLLSPEIYADLKQGIDSLKSLQSYFKRFLPDHLYILADSYLRQVISALGDMYIDP